MVAVERTVARNVFLARQPIYDTRREIAAYELLYRRTASVGAAEVTSAEQATADVVLGAFMEIGLGILAPTEPVFINLPRKMLMMEPLIPADRCVIEVLEDIPVDAETVAALERLKTWGYRIALDDFRYADVYEPFLRLADFVKIDLRPFSFTDFRRQVDSVRRFPVRVVAEKIEDEDELERCRIAGCELFQGYYLRRPETLRGTRINANRLSTLALLCECRNSERPLAAIAEVVGRDPSLARGLLQLANSALYSRQMEITSLRQAVSMLGIEGVSRWASLLVLMGFDDCPVGYLMFAVHRARTCELLANSQHCEASSAYLVGLLSVLDSIANAPFIELIGSLPVHPEIKAALLQHSGKLGRLLCLVESYESGDRPIEPEFAVELGAVQKAYWDATEYAREMISMIPHAR
jgi:EAL and modified HD-GYP domain-containing signal transduction protein